MKRPLYIFAFLSIFIEIPQSQAQQYPLFTNYVINTFGYNPAVIGTQKNLEGQIFSTNDNKKHSVEEAYQRTGFIRHC